MARHEGLHPMRVSRADKVLIQFACDANKTTNDDLYFKYLLKHLIRENVHVSKMFDDLNQDVYEERHGSQKPFLIDGLPDDLSIYLNPVETDTSMFLLKTLTEPVILFVRSL